MSQKILLFIILVVTGYLIFKIVIPARWPSEMELVNTTLNSPNPSVQNQLQLASFLIFTNGTKRDFSDTKYHYQSDAAFITDANPAIIEIVKPAITWGEFFATLPAPFKITDECLFTGTGQQFCTSGNRVLKFYVSGKKVTKILSQPIESGQQLLISYGVETEAEIQAQFTQIPLPTEDSLPRM